MKQNAKWKGFAKIMSVKEGQDLLQNKFYKELSNELIDVENAIGRILYQNIIAKFDLPGFKRSAMDGYAIRAKDSHDASDTNPLQLKIQGVTEIGDTEVLSLNQGCAIRISTGAPLPNNADAVIRIEDCEEIGDDILEIYASLSRGKNVAEKDEDVKNGELIYKKGMKLPAWDIAMLTSLGFDKIEVQRLPRIAILSTGSELVPLKQERKVGQVYDSNRPALDAWVKQYNGDVIYSETCEDVPEIIKKHILKYEDVDLIITTGGTSIGQKDYMAEVIESMGEMYTHGIAIRPGKPLILGSIIFNNHKIPIVALPGYPLATFLNFELFVLPLLTRWNKIDIEHKKDKVILAQRVPSTSGIIDFVRLVKTEEGAKILRITGAGILSSLVHADYLLEIPENVEGYPAGTEVEVRVLRED